MEADGIFAQRMENAQPGRLLVGHCDDASIVIGLVGDARTLIRLEIEEASRLSRDLGKLIRSLKRSQRRQVQGGER